MPTITHRCGKCEQAKPITDFYPNRRTGGVQAACKVCNASASRARYAERRAEILARNRSWDRANPEKRNAALRRARSRNPEKALAVTRRWRENNKAYDAFRSKYRKAMKRQAIPLWADTSAMRATYQRAQQQSRETGTAWHVDHIVPIQSPLVCGLHCEQNFQLLPGRANAAKGNRWWPDMP